MQIKFINIQTLDSKVVNVRNGTMDEVLDEAEKCLPDFNRVILDRNGDVLKFNNYIGDILYHGITKADSKQGRKEFDWSDKYELLMEHYQDDLTASDLSLKSGISLGHVYYIARKFNIKLAKGHRGLRKNSRNQL